MLCLNIQRRRLCVVSEAKYRIPLPMCQSPPKATLVSGHSGANFLVKPCKLIFLCEMHQLLLLNFRAKRCFFDSHTDVSGTCHGVGYTDVSGTCHGVGYTDVSGTCHGVGYTDVYGTCHGVGQLWWLHVKVDHRQGQGDEGNPEKLAQIVLSHLFHEAVQLGLVFQDLQDVVAGVFVGEAFDFREVSHEASDLLDLFGVRSGRHHHKRVPQCPSLNNRFNLKCEVQDTCQHEPARTGSLGCFGLQASVQSAVFVGVCLSSRMRPTHG